LEVCLAQGSRQYREPIEFYSQTFITEDLRKLLSKALLRIVGHGGDPIVELDMNAGSGRTHSALALYRLFCGVPAGQLPGSTPAPRAGRRRRPGHANGTRPSHARPRAANRRASDDGA